MANKSNVNALAHDQQHDAKVRDALLVTWGYHLDAAPVAVTEMASEAMALSVLRIPEVLVHLGVYDKPTVDALAADQPKDMPMLSYFATHSDYVREHFDKILSLIVMTPYFDNCDALFAAGEAREYSVIDPCTILTTTQRGGPRVIFSSFAQRQKWIANGANLVAGDTFTYVGMRPQLSVGDLDAIVSDPNCVLTGAHPVSELQVVDANMVDGVYIGIVVSQNRSGALVKYCKDKAVLIPGKYTDDIDRVIDDGEALAISFKNGIIRCSARKS